MACPRESRAKRAVAYPLARQQIAPYLRSRGLIVSSQRTLLTFIPTGKLLRRVASKGHGEQTPFKAIGAPAYARLQAGQKQFSQGKRNSLSKRQSLKGRPKA